MKFDIKFTDGAGGSPEGMGSSRGIPEQGIVTFVYNTTPEELHEEIEKLYDSSEVQKISKLVDSFEPLEYELKGRLDNQGNTKYDVIETNLKTGERKVVYTTSGLEDAMALQGRLRDDMARKAFKEKQKNESLRQHKERKQKEQEQTRELLKQIERANKTKQINDKMKESMPEKPDICVICLDNTGYEDSFENNVPYLFKGFSGDIWIVEDMNGEDREIFAERFEIVEIQPPWRLVESTMTLVYDPPDDTMEAIECEDCNGTGMTKETKRYGGQPVEVDVECPTCKGDGLVRVPIMRTLNTGSTEKQPSVDCEIIKKEMSKLFGRETAVPHSMEMVESQKDELSTESIDKWIEMTESYTNQLQGILGNWD